MFTLQTTSSYSKMISSPYCAVSARLMFINIIGLTRWNANRFHHYELNKPYLWGLSNSFSISSNAYVFIVAKLFDQVICERTKHKSSSCFPSNKAAMKLCFYFYILRCLTWSKTKKRTQTVISAHYGNHL